MADVTGRWPPVYDAASLKKQIDDLAKAGDFSARFWRLTAFGSDVYQGDIAQLDALVPVLDREGEIAEDGRSEFWLVIGNTCDFARDASDVRWTQIVPLVTLGAEVEGFTLQEHRAYRHSRKFYVPPWPGGDHQHRFADLLRPVAIEKAAFTQATAKVVGRMQYPAWVLLNACMLRFLARDDGRNEAA